MDKQQQNTIASDMPYGQEFSADYIPVDELEILVLKINSLLCNRDFREYVAHSCRTYGLRNPACVFYDNAIKGTFDTCPDEKYNDFLGKIEENALKWGDCGAVELNLPETYARLEQNLSGAVKEISRLLSFIDLDEHSYGKTLARCEQEWNKPNVSEEPTDENLLKDAADIIF